MSRNTLISWGKLIMGSGFVASTTLILLALSGLAIIPEGNRNSFFEFIDSTQKLLFLLIGVLVFIFAYTLACYKVGSWLIEKGKSIRPKIHIVPLNPPDHVENRVDGKLIISTFPSLKIINNEDAELTECFAVLKNGQPGGMPKDVWDWIDPGAKKISWKGTKECVITIGAWNGEEILHIFELSYNASDRKVLSSSFCICNDERGIKSHPVGHDFTIELNCKLNGESIKPIPFSGYFPITIEDTKTFRVSGLVISEGENKDRKMTTRKPEIKPAKK